MRVPLSVISAAKSAVNRILRRPIRVGRNRGLGDVLLATPTLRAIKKANPHRPLHFYTEFPELVAGLPFIDRVLHTSDAKKSNYKLWSIGYESASPPEEHLARIMARGFGLEIHDVRPDCVVDESLVMRFREAWAGAMRPHIVVQRNASGWTPNKNWPDDYWHELLHRLDGKATTIDITDPANDASPITPASIDLRGKLTVPQLVAAIAAVDLLVGPVSGPVHIAAAVRTPAVVIVGGYEKPVNSYYEGNVLLSRAPECSPCWLRTPCPKDRACLRAITPEEVESEIWAAYKRRSGNGISNAQA